MLVDMIAGVLAPLLVAAVAIYTAALLHLVARDTERARWQRQFGGWRTLQRDRIDDCGPNGAGGHRFALLPRLAGLVDWSRIEHDGGAGWTVLQRHRLERRRCDRASW